MLYYIIIYILSRWYFALISLSGAFAVTFSVVFAYVADITSEEERSSAYGLVSVSLYTIYTRCQYIQYIQGVSIYYILGVSKMSYSICRCQQHLLPVSSPAQLSVLS